MFSIEIIMATYNNADFTSLVLEGYLRQTDPGFRVAIADDGSGSEIAALVLAYRSKGLQIRHVWHEDVGYRKAEILNKTIRDSESDYLIFTDNDCIPHSEFVADHRRMAEKGRCVTGRRVNLGKALTRKLLSHAVDIGALQSRWRILAGAATGKLRNPENGLCLPWSLTRLWSRKRKGLLGSNMAVWRDDVLAVNGFDGAFQGYSAEESDLEWRLNANGIKVRALLGRACQYHLYHERRAVDERNLRRIEEKKASGEVWAKEGILVNE